MDYRRVPRTGWDLSVLSFGCMRFESDETAAEAVRRAVELGVNYFDVAPAYGGGTAEPRLGLGLQSVKEQRDKLYVTAKSSPGNGGDGVGLEYNPQTGFGIRSADQARAQIERSLEIIGVDRLDMYHLWACHGPAVFEEAIKPGGFLEGVAKAREEGLFPHIGFTGHMNSADLIKCLEAFPFDMVTIPFHLRDTSRAEAVRYCAAHGIGVIAMNPVAGGALARPLPVLQSLAAGLGLATMTEGAFRYLLSWPEVTTALAGFTYAAQVEEDAAAVANGPLAGDTAEQLAARVHELYANVEHFCTACGYCGECPQGILIPQVLEIYSNLLVPSTADQALAQLAQALAANSEGFDPSLCTACGTCESKCPNSLPISNLMAKAAERWPRA
jgi:predicted aldo/keto reductase-like oxidoreductase